MQEGEFKTLISKSDTPTPLDTELWGRVGKKSSITLREPSTSVSFQFTFNDQGRIMSLESPAVTYYRTDSPHIAAPPRERCVRFAGRRWDGTVDVIHIFSVEAPSQYYLAKGGYCLDVELDAPYSEEDSGMGDSFVTMGWVLAK